MSGVRWTSSRRRRKRTVPCWTVEPVVYQVRRSDRARRVRVTVDPTRGVEVVLPRRAPAREAAAAVRELRPWIERRVAEIEGARAAVAARGDTLCTWGWVCCGRPDAREWTRRGDVLFVPAGAERRTALERWYRRAARSEIEPRLEQACTLAGHVVLGADDPRPADSLAELLTIGGDELQLAPAARRQRPVLDYVVWHEVCHLEVMDHSPRFWRLLATCSPGYQEHVSWLRVNGPTLVL